jgi:DNA-directed RNA polymerase specialized sigma24 family protein
MSSDESMTHLIHILKVGDRLAAQGLWEAYFRRLVRLARARLARTSTPVADAEDVALGAFDSFYRRAERGECPHLEDRNDLWRLLFVLTVRKALDLVRLLSGETLRPIGLWKMEGYCNGEIAAKLGCVE